MAKDLVILCADKNQEFSLRGMVARPAALGLRPVSFEIHTHPERDPGCLSRGTAVLAALSAGYHHALLVFDHAGCGSEKVVAPDLETQCERRMAEQGWLGCATVVIEPELEAWVWSESIEVDGVLGWRSRRPGLRAWLATRDLWPTDMAKPPDPKAAMEAALRGVRKPRSSALYRQLADRVSLTRCTDRAFVKLRSSLAAWFPLS